jgi:hypothetical protein
MNRQQKGAGAVGLIVGLALTLLCHWLARLSQWGRGALVTHIVITLVAVAVV